MLSLKQNKLMICAFSMLLVSGGFIGVQDRVLGLSSLTQEPSREKLSDVSVDELVKRLPSKVGATRVAASKELFRRGKKTLPHLKKAGAKTVATVRSSRLDMVYSLIEGLKPKSYARDSFGIHLEPGVKKEKVLEMAVRHGFSLPRDFTLKEGVFPTLYVKLNPERTLETVLKNILTTEAQVITVNLNYVVHERKVR